MISLDLARFCLKNALKEKNELLVDRSSFLFGGERGIRTCFQPQAVGERFLCAPSLRQRKKGAAGTLAAHFFSEDGIRTYFQPQAVGERFLCALSLRQRKKGAAGTLAAHFSVRTGFEHVSNRKRLENGFSVPPLSANAKRVPLAPLRWRRERDSNPRVLSHKLISSQPRYDHFDISPLCLLITDQSIISHFFKKSNT